MTSISESFLQDGASAEDIWHALRLNVEAWYERCALALPGGLAHSVGDVLLTRNHATIPTAASVSDDSQIDAILNWYRSRPEPDTPILWYLDPTPPPPRLTARLLARGVSTNWQPHWMIAYLKDAPIASQSSADFDIRVPEPGDESTLVRGEDRIADRLAKAVPRLVWRLAAFESGKVVGRCVLNITTGRYGVAGLFDMYVDPEYQKKGIGSALLSASRRFARDFGCRFLYVNSTDAGESMYARGGFVSLCRGTTWHLRDGFSKTIAPKASLVKFLEALGQGKIQELDELSENVTSAEMQYKTTNTMTPLEIAVHLSQSESAAWLIAHGVIPDIVSLWDLGWRDQARQLIVDHPDEVNRKQRDHNETAVHTAVARDDVDMMQMLLAAPNADLTVVDDVFCSTAMGWAQYLKRDGMVILLQRRAASGHSFSNETS